jgi:putative membrane protein
MESLNHSIERAEKHYYSLFTMPSYPRIAVFTGMSCFLSGIVALLPFNFSFDGILSSVQFGLAFFLASVVSDVIIRQIPLRSDPVYKTRRCAGLSMFSNLLWIGYLALGSLDLWFDPLWICFSAICILRLIVFSATSYSAYWRNAFAAIFQPLLCLLPMTLYVPYSIEVTATDLLFSISISLLTAYSFIRSVNRVGVRDLQIPTTSILKAFLANWMEGLNGPVESLLESLGGERTIEFSAMAFKSKTKLKAMIIVPSFHPGPFRNVGSSSLPFMIQEALEKKLGCFAAVPHGLFGHEFDLSSQAQNQKVLKDILESTDFDTVADKGTVLVRASNGVASASCQIFGKCAFISLTLAPETTEDFPKEIGDFILEEAAKLALSHVIIVNAHNSIHNPFDVRSVVKSLQEVALKALREASQATQYPFEVGVAKVIPREFSLADGMGFGGINVLLIKSNGKICTYVTIDGNNMVSGLRERILELLKSSGIDSGEIFTTDTHAVNAIKMTTRGYHPIGEAIPHDKLLRHIEQGVSEALSNMEPASFGHRVGAVAEVGVIGEAQIKKITLLADKALHHAKKIAVPLFGAAGAALIIFHVLI